MCTLTYLPSPAGYTFTHNRDERMDRPTSREFRVREVKGQTLYFPEDLEAHGTWIAFSNNGISACLMNGGSLEYTRKLPYRHSRGLVVLHFFEYDSVQQFHEEYNLENIEPFTLVIRDKKGLWRITHNENETTLDEEDADSPNIWASTTLYTRKVRDKRKEWFTSWLRSTTAITPENIREFHRTAGDGDSENDLVMSRWGTLKTLSITQIAVTSKRAELVYEDFVQKSRDYKEVLLPS